MNLPITLSSALYSTVTPVPHLPEITTSELIVLQSLPITSEPVTLKDFFPTCPSVSDPSTPPTSGAARRKLPCVSVISRKFSLEKGLIDAPQSKIY
jgi:hypothetical protein